MISCYMCNNAHTDSSLNSNNDLSYVSVGRCLRDYSMFIRFGDNRPTVIVFQHWSELLKSNVTVGEYVFSYCPNCGRNIFENDECK